jgi:hypothetical protein
VLGNLFLIALKLPNKRLHLFQSTMRIPRSLAAYCVVRTRMVRSTAAMRQNYKETLSLPRTDFPMKANLAAREPGESASVAIWFRLWPALLKSSADQSRSGALRGVGLYEPEAPAAFLFQQKRDEGVASTRFASFSTELTGICVQKRNRADG